MNKESKQQQEDHAFLFTVVRILFGGSSASFGKHLAESGGLTTRPLTVEDNLQTAGFDFDLQEEMVGRFRMIKATLNWGNKRYIGKILYTPDAISKMEEFLKEETTGHVKLIMWGKEPNGYRYLSKRGLSTNFTMVSIKETSKLH